MRVKTVSGVAIPKLYHSIAEVSALTGVEAHVLRYWETEFEGLRPRKNRSGHRIYTDADIALVRRIAHLMHTEKYTLEGARLRLARDEAEAAHRARLHDLRAFLANLLERLPAG